MTKKEKFIAEIESITQNFEDPAPLEVVLSEDAYSYFLELKNGKAGTSDMTENGLKVLTFMQENHEKYNNVFTSKIIGEGLFISSRSASGSMPKLITLGYVNKLVGSPVSYEITPAGLAFNKA
jgi:hypothetical protein